LKYKCTKCANETDAGECILDVGISKDIPCACPYGQPFVNWKPIKQDKAKTNKEFGKYMERINGK